MNKTEKIKYIIETLELLFPDVPIPLDHNDPYTLLIAVLLSAQSTDVGVNKITPILFKKADNPYDMVKLTVDEIDESIYFCMTPCIFTRKYGSILCDVVTYAGNCSSVLNSFSTIG